MVDACENSSTGNEVWQTRLAKSETVWSQLLNTNCQWWTKATLFFFCLLSPSVPDFKYFWVLNGLGVRNWKKKERDYAPFEKYSLKKWLACMGHFARILFLETKLNVIWWHNVSGKTGPFVTFPFAASSGVLSGLQEACILKFSSVHVGSMQSTGRDTNGIASVLGWCGQWLLPFFALCLSWISKVFRVSVYRSLTRGYVYIS